MANGHLMPEAARKAAIETFARVTRERHPGIVVVPLLGVGANRSVVAAASGQVIWPFASPEDRRSLLDGDTGVAALDDHRIDGASKDALAILDG